MKDNQRTLFDEMLSFYLVVATNPESDLRRIRTLMDSLLRKAKLTMEGDDDVKSKISTLLKLVYREWGFRCDPDRYFDSSNLYLDRVLETRYGMPVSLGAIVLYLAAGLELPLYPVDFPTQLILRAEAGERVAFIDPWDGRYFTRRKLLQFYEGAVGFGVKLKMSELEPFNASELAKQFRQLIKNSLIREEKTEDAWKYIDSLLKKSPQDPYEIRDRGLVLAQMGCYHAAVDDLIYFMEQCPEDPTSFMLLGRLHELRQNFYSIH